MVALSLFVGCTYDSKEDIANLPATDINKLNVSSLKGLDQNLSSRPGLLKVMVAR